MAVEGVPVEQLGASVIADNLKGIAGQSASLANLALANATNLSNLSNLAALDALNNHRALMHSIVSRAAETIIEPDPMEAVSAQKILSGNDLGQQLAQLGAVIASLQQSMKGAQTTPPETGK